ncbi:hypothetical protein E1B28_006768 [Marasmius oreades]|uniref:Uncharacterized protein n=1 Tax=Marasmius oreades TaxID=181124 RepID=A0A9P7UWS3_9AGAR|nr:uncharacterized protein E1B28_006768 [Marasmius oreades]KAG7096092.1 hypothetical protein E1B28_006768 [Marasmius oreades]
MDYNHPYTGAAGYISARESEYSGYGFDNHIVPHRQSKTTNFDFDGTIPPNQSYSTGSYHRAHKTPQMRPSVEIPESHRPSESYLNLMTPTPAKLRWLRFQTHFNRALKRLKRCLHGLL